LRSLRHGEFRRFWVGLIISVTGRWMQQAAQALLVYELTHSMLALGLLGACSTLPILVLTLPAGVLADRISKRNILLVTQTLAMVQAFVLAILTFSGVVQVWHVMLLALFLGVANSLDMPARHAMVVELAGRDDLLNAVSINSSAFNAARIVGPAAAGMLIPVTGMAGCFLINGLTFLALIFALVGIRPKQPSGEARGPMLPQIRDGLSWAKGQPIARTVLAMIAVSSIFAMSYGTLLPVFALDIFHAGPRGYGFLMSSYAVGALASALMLTAFGHRWRLGGLVTAGSLFLPVALLCFSLSPAYGLAIGSLFLTGAGMMVFNAVANTMLQKLSPDAMRGRVMSMRTLLFAGMMPIGSLQMGAIGEWLGPRAAVGIGAAVCMIAALTAWRLVPALRRSD
jgi:MFS family permease